MRTNRRKGNQVAILKCGLMLLYIICICVYTYTNIKDIQQDGDDAFHCKKKILRKRVL